MKFEKVFNNKKYVRKIESMGEGLVLFEISVVDKRVGQNYHLFFEDKRKPPLDIAINPDDGMIEYISYFAQDEMINNISDIPEIINEDMGISICNKDFNEDNMNVTVDGRFKFWKLENTILILKNDIEELVLNAYRINDLMSVDEHSNTLKTLDEVFEGNRLDYDNTAFKIRSGVDGVSKSVGNADIVYGKITYILDDVDGDILGIYDAKTGVLTQQFVYDSDLGWLLK